jgi:hypothetical protein
LTFLIDRPAGGSCGREDEPVPRRVLTTLAVLTLGADIAVYLLRGTGKGLAPDDPEESDDTGPLLVVHHDRDWHFGDCDLFGRDVGLDTSLP